MGTQKRTNLGPYPCDSLPWKQIGPSRAGPAVHSQCCGAPESRAWLLLVIMLPDVTSPYGNPHHLPPIFFNFGFSLLFLAWLSWHISFRSEHHLGSFMIPCFLSGCIQFKYKVKYHILSFISYSFHVYWQMSSHKIQDSIHFLIIMATHLREYVIVANPVDRPS